MNAIRLLFLIGCLAGAADAQYRWKAGVAAVAECPAPPASREAARARFQQYEKAAQEAFRQRDFSRAAGNLRQAICFDPENGRAYHELGLAEAAAGNFERADAALAQAERRSPRDFGILLSHAQVQLSLEKPDMASRTLREARRHQPARPTQVPALARAYALLGRAYVKQNQLDLAIAAFLRAAHAGQQDVETVLLLATLENSEGAYADAIEHALRVQVGADVSDAQKGAAAAIAGLAYKNQKLNEDAIPLLRQAVQLAPSETGFLALAEIYEATDKPQDAAKLLEQGRKQLPESTRIAIALGRNLANTGDARRALEPLTDATRKTPGDPESWRWLAQAETSLGQMKEAAASLQEIARRAPDYPMIHTMIAQALLKIDPADYSAALRALDGAQQATPSDPEIYYMRGKIYSEQARYEAAVAALRRAIELRPTLATPYYQLGLVYQKLGRQAEAAAQFERFAFLKK